MADHSSLGSFGRAFKGRGSQLESEVVRAMKEVALGVVTEVATATPIDTGQAQSNWLTNIGYPVSYYYPNEDSNGAAGDSIALAKGVLRSAKIDSEIHITNNVPYIVKLNRGTSKQAPALFVQAAVLRASYQLKNFKIIWL